jgi:hypothetical protein
VGFEVQKRFLQGLSGTLMVDGQARDPYPRVALEEPHRLPTRV